MSVTMTHRTDAPRRAALLLLLLVPVLVRRSGAEFPSKLDPDYEFGDYRGKWCIDDHGFVYAIGEVYYPSPTACPCTCTVDGPLCVRPRCPRIHPRCTRIKYKACCPVCEAMARVCLYGGKTYRLLEEFRVRATLLSLARFYARSGLSARSWRGKKDHFFLIQRLATPVVVQSCVLKLNSSIGIGCFMDWTNLDSYIR